jgi:hypothetical protein
MTKMGLPPVISFTGVGQVGKTEVAKYLKERYGYGGDHINEPMVAMAIPLLERMGCTHEDAVSRLTTARKAEPIPGYEWLTGRKILQAVGYDLRNALGRLTDVSDTPDESFFLDMWERRHSRYERLVNESARYPVEIDWTEDRGGIVILVDAKGAEAANGHISETKSLPHDYLLFNDFDGLPRLHAKVDAILREWASPSNAAYELPERRMYRMYGEHPDVCGEVWGHVHHGDGTGRAAFETIERDMERILLARTVQRFSGNDGKVVEMQRWIDEKRGHTRMRAAAVVGHFGVPDFKARYAALTAA